MGRRKKRGDPSVTLFPFLSVLACVIGVLTLMITALAIGQMQEKHDPRDKQRARDLSNAKTLLANVRSELNRVHNLTEEAASVQEQLRLVLDELAKLQKEQTVKTQRAKEAAERKSSLTAEAATLKKRAAEIAAELKSFDAEIARLNAELARRTAPPPEAAIKVRSSGTGVGLDPSFVECRAEGLVVHTQTPAVAVPLADIGANKTFIELLETVAKSQRGIVIFLTRTDGTASYYRARDVARDHRSRNGKIPVDGQGALDLDSFRTNETDAEEPATQP